MQLLSERLEHVAESLDSLMAALAGQRVPFVLVAFSKDPAHAGLCITNSTLPEVRFAMSEWLRRAGAEESSL